MESFYSLKLDLSQCPMRRGLLDLIGVWVLGKEKGREIEKEREKGMGLAVFVGLSLRLKERQRLRNRFLY